MLIFWIGFIIFWLLIAFILLIVGTVASNQGPKNVNDVIDAAFNRDVEDMLEYIRQGMYRNGTLPDNNPELAQLAYEFLSDWAMRSEN